MKTCDLCAKDQAILKGGFYFGSSVDDAEWGEVLFCLRCKESLLKRDRVKRLLANFLIFLVGIVLIALPLAFLNPDNEFAVQVIALTWFAFIVYMLVRIIRLHRYSPELTGQVIEKALFKHFRTDHPDSASGELHFWSRGEYDDITGVKESGSEVAGRPATAPYREPDVAQLVGGLVVLVVFGILTWWQLEKFSNESEWIIFRIGFVPVPTVLISGAAAVGGLVLVARQISLLLKRQFKVD